MTSLFQNAELVRRLMRAVQHLSVKDCDGIAEAMAALEQIATDDPEVADEIGGSLTALRAAADGGDVLPAIDALAGAAERLIEVGFFRVRPDRPQPADAFWIRDPLPDPGDSS